MIFQSAFGQARRYGPPFADKKLQATYEAEARKLASDILIPEGTARNLVASVINSTLAAVDARLPDIERRVREEATAAVMAEIPTIERQVRAAAVTAAPELERRLKEVATKVVKQEAKKGATAGVARLFQGALVVSMLGVAAVGGVMAFRR